MNRPTTSPRYSAFFSLLMGTLLVSQAPRAQAASFDCQKASSLVEHAICDSPALSKKDEAMSKAWQKTYAWTKEAYKKEASQPALLQLQRRWLKERNACTTPECIHTSYDRQLAIWNYLNEVPSPLSTLAVVQPKGKSCLSGEFEDSTLLKLNKKEYQELSGYFKEMYDAKSPYYSFGLTIEAPSSMGDISGGGSAVYRYGNRLDDVGLTGKTISQTQAVGLVESSFGGLKKILITCQPDGALQIITLATQGEYYTADGTLKRATPQKNAKK